MKFSTFFHFYIFPFSIFLFNIFLSTFLFSIFFLSILFHSIFFRPNYSTLFCSIAFVFCLNRPPGCLRLKISYCTTNYPSIHFFWFSFNHDYNFLLFFLSVLLCSIAFVFCLNCPPNGLSRKISYCTNIYPSIHFFLGCQL